MRAMILAAGLGTRMRPLSNHLAKPALPVCGRPVIRLLLELLADDDRGPLVRAHAPTALARLIETANADDSVKNLTGEVKDTSKVQE